MSKRTLYNMHKLLKQLTHPTGKFWVFLEIKIERTHMHAILKFLAEAVRFEPPMNNYIIFKDLPKDPPITKLFNGQFACRCESVVGICTKEKGPLNSGFLHL